MLNFCKVTGTTIKTYSVTERGTSNLYVYNSKYWYGVNKNGTKEQYTIYPVDSTFGKGTNRVHIIGSDNKEYFIDRLMYKAYNGFTMAVSDNSGVKNGCHRPISFTCTMSCNSPKSTANSSYNEGDAPATTAKTVTFTISDNGSTTSKTFYNATTSSTVTSTPSGSITFNYSTYFDKSSTSISFPGTTSATLSGVYRCTEPSRYAYTRYGDTFNGPFKIKVSDGSTTQYFTSSGDWTGYVTQTYTYTVSSGGGGGSSGES